MKEKAVAFGFAPTQSLLQQVEQRTSSTLQHVNMGFLACGNKLKPLLSEFSAYQIWIFRVDKNEADIDKALLTMPKGSRLVHRKRQKLGDVRVCDIDGKMLKQNADRNDTVEKISFGISIEPACVKEAVKAGHPRFLDYKSIDEVDNIIFKNLQKDATQILCERTTWLKKWVARAQELQEDEKKAPHCATVLRAKRLLLLGEMLREINYPDKNLVSDTCEGFRVMGWMRDSGCFTKFPKQPSLSIKALLGMAKGLNEAVLAKSFGQNSDGVIQAAWDETQLELERAGYGKTADVTFVGFLSRTVLGCNKRRR